MADTKTRKRKSKGARKASDPTGLKAAMGTWANIWYLFLRLLDEAGVLVAVASRLSTVESARVLLSVAVEAIVTHVRQEDMTKLPVLESTRWREKDGVIYFTLVSNGMTGPQWTDHFKKKGICVGGVAKKVLNSEQFRPTLGVKYEIAVMKGELFTDDDRITSKIRAEAERRKFQNPSTEVACLIRDMFSDHDIEEMGLWAIIVLHEPFDLSDDSLYLLGAGRLDVGRWLRVVGGLPGYGWDRFNGFASVVPQVLHLES